MHEIPATKMLDRPGDKTTAQAIDTHRNCSKHEPTACNILAELNL